MRHSVILIPSLNPDGRLIPYVKELLERKFRHIIVVNDGSGKEYDPVFHELEDMGCIVLKHAANYGKGRALKNGFNEFLNRFGENENICGVITADSDGQHLVKDVVRMDEAMYEKRNEKKLFLGVRDFKRPNVPPKSRFGNELTCFFFRLLYGRKVSDTQTGLRGIPAGCVENFLTLRGERFEYETSLLIAAVRKRICLEELQIETVYLENNGGTHFRPLQDSCIIYGILFGEFLKYIASSLSASAIDILLFFLLSMWIPGTVGIWIATALARAVSSFYNYSMNRKVVFDSGVNMRHSLWRYYLLCVIQGACSAWLVSGLFAVSDFPKAMCKIIVDTVLFFVSYQIQRRFVFAGERFSERGI